MLLRKPGHSHNLLLAHTRLSEISSKAIANPRKVKAFAIALGKAKTDKLDAQVIAHFAQTVQPRTQPSVAPQAQQLSDLVRRRQ